jgi:hypothetical protein
MSCNSFLLTAYVTGIDGNTAIMEQNNFKQSALLTLMINLMDCHQTMGLRSEKPVTNIIILKLRYLNLNI